MNRTSLVSKFFLATIALLVISPFAHAGRGGHGGGNFAQKHPRRAEVNQRERNQIHRINKGVRNGSLTKEEGKELRGNVRDIKKEERAEVKENGGHLTKAEQKDLNQKLNENSQSIYQQKHDGSTTTPAAPAETAPNAQ